MMARDLARCLDPVLMARDCGIEPDPWQADLLCSTSRYVLLLASRQSGKTTTTGLIAIHCAIYLPGALIVILSPSQRQSAEMLRTLKLLLSKLEGAPALASESTLKIELANGSRILALPGTEKTVRGLAGVDLILLDEASRIEDELIAAIRPMLATKPNGRLIALTTPAGKRGWFYDAWTGTGDWERVRVPASMCPRISQEFLDEELKELGAIRFSEEYGLEFRDNEEAVFPLAVIDAAFTSEVQPLWQ